MLFLLSNNSETKAIRKNKMINRTKIRIKTHCSIQLLLILLHNFSEWNFENKLNFLEPKQLIHIILPHGL